ncbi:MAG: hypothetical protein WCG44_04355, partial [bacterium]
MKKFLFFILLLILIPVAGLAYLGFVPGVSKYIAKPVDLGVKVDPSYTDSLEQKINFKNELPGGVVPVGREGVFSGSIKVDEQVSSVAATSILAQWKRRSPSLPVRDVQVRFNDDGTAEVSGVLEIATAISVAKTLGYSDADIEKGKSYAKYVSGDLPFYVKGTTGATNNQISISPSDFQLGKVSVPESITTPAARVVEDVIERRIKQVGGINLESIKLGSGSLQF